MTLCRDCEFWRPLKLVGKLQPHYCSRISTDTIEARIVTPLGDTGRPTFETYPEFGCVLGRPLQQSHYAELLTGEKHD